MLSKPTAFALIAGLTLISLLLHSAKALQKPAESWQDRCDADSQYFEKGPGCLKYLRCDRGELSFLECSRDKAWNQAKGTCDNRANVPACKRISATTRPSEAAAGGQRRLPQDDWTNWPGLEQYKHRWQGRSNYPWIVRPSDFKIKIEIDVDKEGNKEGEGDPNGGGGNGGGNGGEGDGGNGGEGGNGGGGGGGGNGGEGGKGCGGGKCPGGHQGDKDTDSAEAGDQSGGDDREASDSSESSRRR